MERSKLTRSDRSRGSSFLICLLVAVLCIMAGSAVAEEEIKWTPNPHDEADRGPLPLSNRQRQQLLQLQDAIQRSPDPQATLLQVAQANQMEPEELVSMLERNHREMQQAGGTVGQGMASPGRRRRQSNVLWKITSSSILVLIQAASKNPRAFALATMALSLALYIAVMAPRTGLIISNHRGGLFLSHGPTTVWNPPTSFLHKYVESIKTKSVGSTDTWNPIQQLFSEISTQDGPFYNHKPQKSSQLASLASFQTTVPVEDITLPLVDVEDGQAEETDSLTKQALEMCFEHASDVLEHLQLTEFASQQASSTLRLIPDSKKRYAILVAKRMGDWKRYGLLPLKVASREDADDSSLRLTLSTLKGSHWDGQIHVVIKKTVGPPSSISIRCIIAVPKKGARLSKKLALSITESLSTSIAASIRTRTKQTLARKFQSMRFQQKASAKAKERRSIRLAKEKEMEEMASDRRRRWQRENPNSGHYRPSGDRMRSPNNAVY